MLSIIFGIALALIHYFSERFEVKNKERRHKIVSFVAGISITYIFLLLIPEVYGGIVVLEEFLFLFILAGFSTFHLIEKHIYQHKSKAILHEELRVAHSAMFFFYHFVIGILLVQVIELNFFNGVLFFIPVFFHAALSSASLKRIHISMREKIFLKAFLSLSTLFGVIASYTILIPQPVIYSLLGFIVGSLLYVVIRDSIPEETEGKVIYFVLGVLIYSIIIGFTWLV
jgi:hypothetical protein